MYLHVITCMLVTATQPSFCVHREAGHAQAATRGEGGRNIYIEYLLGGREVVRVRYGRGGAGGVKDKGKVAH